MFSLIFAKNSVDKIMSGKHYSRAIWAHDLLLTALKTLLVEQVKDQEIVPNNSILYDTYVNSRLSFDFHFDDSKVQTLITDIDTL